MNQHATVIGKTALLAFAAFFLSLGLALLAPSTAHAANTGYYDMPYQKSVTVAKGDSGLIELGSKANGAKKITVKSSKPGTVKVKASGSEVSFKAKKKGKATITIKVKKSGTVKTYKMKVKSIAYKNPVKSIKIGGKTLTSKYASATTVYCTLKTAKRTIAVKPKSGWKVSSIYYVNSTSDGSLKTVKTSNNGKVSWKNRKTQAVCVFLYNSSKHQCASLTIANPHAA